MRFDERSYFSVFLIAQHTLVAEIFVTGKRAFPIATFHTAATIARADCDNRNDAGGHEDGQQQGTDQERLHDFPGAEARVGLGCDAGIRVGRLQRIMAAPGGPGPERKAPYFAELFRFAMPRRPPPHRRAKLGNVRLAFPEKRDFDTFNGRSMQTWRRSAQADWREACRDSEAR